MWFRAECLEEDCRWFALWTTSEAAQADCVWHAYLLHPQTWLERMGNDDPPPVRTLPADLGEMIR